MVKYRGKKIPPGKLASILLYEAAKKQADSLVALSDELELVDTSKITSKEREILDDQFSKKLDRLYKVYGIEKIETEYQSDS